MTITEEHFWIAAGVIVALMAGMSKAHPHSWYDPWCCNTSDCQPINADEVSERDDGYHYRQWVIPYKEARVSIDKQFHACEYPKGTMRCFYAPERSF